MPEEKIVKLEELATELVGDGKSPDLFFVSDKGVVVTVTRNFDAAYQEWCLLAYRYRPLHECALEDRLFGTIACVQPESDESTKLVAIDNSLLFKSMYPNWSK